MSLSVIDQVPTGSLLGGRQNYDPFLGTLNIGCRIIIGIQKGTMILTTTLLYIMGSMGYYVILLDIIVYIVGCYGIF